MSIKPEEAKAALVEKAIADVRERLPEPQAGEVEQFVRAYYADTALEDLAELDLYGAALSHWHLMQRRRPGEAKVHVYTPQVEEHGWQSPHTVVETVTDDMPGAPFTCPCIRSSGFGATARGAYRSCCQGQLRAPRSR